MQRTGGTSTMPIEERPVEKLKPPEKPRAKPISRQILSLAVLVLVIIATAIVTYNVRSCQNDIALKANSPRNVAFLMTKSFKENNFANFQGLLTEQARIQINSDQFGTFQKLNTENALFGTYALVRLENGRLIMAYMTPPDENGLYKIQDIKIVPAEMNTLFNHAK
jgi:hypothetical protein